MRIGIYGGAFNPIHVGHLKVITHALAVGNLDELWVLPAWKHSFGKDMLPFQHRMAMAREAVGGVFGHRVQVKDYEKLFQTTYTVDLIENLRRMFPEHQFVLVVGPDILATASQWHRWDDLVQQVDLLEIPEQGTERSTKIREAIRSGRSQEIDGMLPTAVWRYIQGLDLYVTPSVEKTA